MKSIVFRLLLFAGLMSTTMGWSATISSTKESDATSVEEVLTWEQCLAEAALKNPDLQKAESALAAASYSKSAALGQFLPDVSVGASQGKSGNQASPFAEGESRESTGVNLSIQQNLFNGFKTRASYTQASAKKEQAQAELDNERAQVSRDLKVAFYNLLYIQQQVPMLQDIAARQKENVRMVNLKYQSGRENRGSYLQSLASAEEADYEVSQAKRSLRLAQRQLARVLGRSELDTLQVKGSFTSSVPKTSPDFKTIAAGLPASRIAAAQLRSAKSQVTSAKGAFLPSLNASGSMSRSGEDWMPEDPSWSVGLSLSYSLFSGGQDYYSLKNAKESRTQAEINVATVQKDLALKLEDAFSSLQDAVERTVVRKRNLEASKVREEIANAQYANGLVSNVDWDQLESALITSQKNNLQGLLDAKKAEAEWELAQGKGELK